MSTPEEIQKSSSNNIISFHSEKLNYLYYYQLYILTPVFLYFKYTLREFDSG